MSITDWSFAYSFLLMICEEELLKRDSYASEHSLAEQKYFIIPIPSKIIIKSDCHLLKVHMTETCNSALVKGEVIVPPQKPNHPN